MLKRQKGQGLVEFALISPVLLLIILAIIETALIFQGYLAVQHAAREAARWAVTYRPDKGQDLDGNPCCFSETDEEYWARRVAMIKQVAVDSGVGLRIDQSKLGLTDLTFNAYLDEPNFYGVEVWGAMDFFVGDINDSKDQPGLPGLPVRVRVTHNVELLDPIFRAIVPRVRVIAQSEMINEGTQAGFGNQAPPALPPPPPIPPGPTPGSGNPVVDFAGTTFTIGESQGSATIIVVLDAPADETITVNYSTQPDTALPGDDYQDVGDILNFPPGITSQEFSVPIIDDTEEEEDERLVLQLSGGNATIGTNNPAELIIVDDDGTEPVAEFNRANYSVNEDTDAAAITVVLDHASGQVISVDYATSDGTATAGADYVAINGTLTFNPGQTSQTFLVPINDDLQDEADETINLTLSNAVNATIGTNNPVPLRIIDDDAPPTPTPTGPFVTASDYVVIPTQLILIDVNQHQPLNVYELHWVDENFNSVAVISSSVRVEADGFKRNIQFTIPDTSTGTYHVETRRGAEIVRSAAIQVTPPPPDLIVTGIGVPEEILPNEEITITVEVQNQSPSLVSGYFDVDLYVDPANEPMPSQPGTSKQWLEGIAPLGTEVVTHVVTLYGGGAHELWAQVDTSDWVPDEFDESNNVFGPVGVTAASGECSDQSDHFYRQDLDPKWSATQWGNASVHNQTIEEVDGDRALTIETSGDKIGSTSESATFLYQSFTGDFVATLKINWGPDTGDYAKIGLMVRANLNANSPMVAASKTNAHGLQFLYRSSAGAGANTFHSNVSGGVPAWVRLVRNGRSVSAFYSFDGSSWSEAGGANLNDLPNTVWIGIAAASYSSGSATGNVDDFEVCPIDRDAETCQGYSDDFGADSSIAWLDADIGDASGGSSNKSGGEMVVEGNGSGLWGTDNFHYTYQQLTGNFVATLKINAGPGQAQWSKGGLMVRDVNEPGDTRAPRVMVMKTRDHGVQFGYRDGGTYDRFANDTENSTLPVWVRIARNGNAFSAFHSTDGQSWIYAGSVTVNMSEDVRIGMAVSNYSSNLGTGRFDDFLFCAGEPGAIEPPIIPPSEKPPGLRECVGNPQTIELGGFEASQITPPWQRNVDAFHANSEKHTGNFSLGFRAKRSRPPANLHLTPWAYQAVAVPGDVLTGTTGTLTFWQFVEPDPTGSTPDADDQFYLAIRDSNGLTVTADIPLASGDTATPVFQQNVISVENYLTGGRFADFAGQDIQLKFYGVHDGDTVGTHFYIDDVRLDICTTQPIPDDIPGTASIGGLVEVLLAGVPTKMPGISVWASLVGGEMYRTQTIHDSTYHFYNVPPGNYTLYAEVWVGGFLYTSTTEVTVFPDERNYALNMLLR